jgi:Uma2 family endonuclease
MLIFAGEGTCYMTTTRAKATIADLYNAGDSAKAEIVNGEVVLMSPTGAKPGRASFNIASSLRKNEKPNNPGRAFGDNVGFVVDLPNRKSFSPDAAWYIGDIDSMKFLDGAPAFAAEVRSENDYVPEAEKRIAEKRHDYFAAGTQVVWDVDLLSDDVVKVYRANEPDYPAIYRRGEIAEAEPAVPGWTMAVEELFE